MKDKNLIFHQNYQQFNQVRIVNYDLNNQNIVAANKGLRQARLSSGYENLKTPKTDA